MEIPPKLMQAKSLLCARVCDKFSASGGMNATNQSWIDALDHENYHRGQMIFQQES